MQRPPAYLYQILWEKSSHSLHAVARIHVAPFGRVGIDEETSAEQSAESWGLWFSIHPNFGQHFLAYAMDLPFRNNVNRNRWWSTKWASSFLIFLYHITYSFYGTWAYDLADKLAQLWQHIYHSDKTALLIYLVVSIPFKCHLVGTFEYLFEETIPHTACVYWLQFTSYKIKIVNEKFLQYPHKKNCTTE